MIRSYLKSKAKQKLGKYRDKLHAGLLDACEELKSHRKTNPADTHFEHIQAELAEMGVVIKKKYVRPRGVAIGQVIHYQVYMGNITKPKVRKSLTFEYKNLYDAWEAGKEMVAELAKLQTELLNKQ